MKLYDVSNQNGKAFVNAGTVPENLRKSRGLFILCKASEVPHLQSVFGFDESTVLNCTDLDESVRYSSFDGYDFVSLVHMEREHSGIALREINLYVSRHYLTLVMPETEGSRLAVMEKAILDAVENMADKNAALNRLYVLIFQLFLSDISDLLEELEDEAEALSESIIARVAYGQFANISRIRKMAYTARKQLRALSYVSEQILVDGNMLIEQQRQLRYFSGIDTRIKKLYAFAESLYDLGDQLLGTYDSKQGMKTNDIVTKLTVLTFFCAPLTVIAGIYGMNFEFMPELKMRYAYPVVIALMLGLCGVLYWILKRKKWL